MKIRYITIYNFRGIEKLDKLKVSNLNTFVGKNDSGKSAILRALNCFFDEKKFDRKDIFKGKNSEDSTTLELSFDPGTIIDDLALDTEGLVTIRKNFLLDGKGKVKSTTDYLSEDFVDEKYQDLWNRKESELNEIIKQLGGKVRKSGRGNKNIERINQIKELLPQKDRKNVYHSLDDFLKNIEKEYSIALPEYSLFDAEQDLDIGASTFQSQFKTLISDSFEKNADKTSALEKEIKQDLCNEFDEIKKFMTKNVPGLKKLSPVLECDWKKSVKFDLDLSCEGEDYDVPISHKGTGFKRLLMVAYFEYLARKKSVKNQIFAIEEPETYLHPAAQEDLLQSIIGISESSQFFLTTHSPVFAGATDENDVILVKKTGIGISEYDRGDKIVQSIIDELGIRPDYNLLKNTKFLIFVEGRDDIHFLQSAAQTLLGKNLDDDAISCVIGGGSSLKNYVDLDLFRKLSPGGQSNKYAVFVDGDSGDITKEKEKAKIKSHCEQDDALFHRLSKKEVENYCSPERIKEVYIKEIKVREGEDSRNPRISEIRGLTFEIQPDTDVESYLSNIGLGGFKSGKNIEVFQLMSKEEWDSMDPPKEVKNFLEKVYQLL